MWLCLKNTKLITMKNICGINYLYVALSGLDVLIPYPGRCPGLVCIALSGQKICSSIEENSNPVWTHNISFIMTAYIL